MSGVGVEPGTVRQSGKTGAQEDAVEEIKDIPRTMESDLVDDDPEMVRTPKFMRMRTQYTPAEARLMGSVFSDVDEIIGSSFGDAVEILNEIISLIREQVTIDGELMFDDYGKPLWRRNAAGRPIEDFTRLTRAQMQDFFGRITLHLVAWEQEAAQFLGAALFAKAQFEERYAIAYDEPVGRVTVEGRQAIANSDAAEERYHAVFRTMVSKRADAMVHSMDRLCQRLKDALQTS